MTDLDDALRDPIPLTPNRIPRFYRGGRMLGEFRAEPDAADDGRPEDWVGSATRTWTPPGAAPSDLGLSAITVGGRTTTLATLLNEAPAALVGAAWVGARQPSLGVLVKLLDAGERLPVHAHPTREAAARLLGSAFGKTEAWIILGVRDGAIPRVWAGLREPVAHQQLRDWIGRQDSEAMLGALVEHAVAPGDVILVPGGQPHAIGAGVFLLELQEPTDFSVVAETRGFPIHPADASLRLGWDAAIEFFATDPVGDLRQRPVEMAPGVTSVFSAAADPYFRALRHRPMAGRDEALPFEPGFTVGVVTSGEGELHGARQPVALRPGVTVAVPAAAVGSATLTAEEGLEVVWCLPPAEPPG
jgi:mannose-6-phosphate isomerase